MGFMNLDRSAEMNEAISLVKLGQRIFSRK
jgi:hypothetical protein